MNRESDNAAEKTFREHSVDFGKYHSIARLGQGGMAEVFLAVARGPVGFHKLVVIKRLLEHMAEDASHREMFLDEARLAARLNHPNIVQTYEVTEHDGAFLITMEYLEGQPLSRVVHELQKRNRKIDGAIFTRIVSDVLSGLHYAHEARDYDGVPLNIVHRDVSPENIFVTYDGQIKIVDFGIAKAEMSNTKTQAGMFKGKAAYMAPEQLIGDTIDRRVDIFTTGIVLWELLTGKRLMAAGSTAKTLLRVLQEPILPPSSIVTEIDPKLDAIVNRALEREPTARYATAQDMRDALEKFHVLTMNNIRQDDIAALMNELFSDVRARVQKEIRAKMTAMPVSGSMPAAGRSIDGEGSGIIAEGSFAGMSVSGSFTKEGTLRRSVPTGVSPLPDPRQLAPANNSKRTAVRVVAGAVLALGLGTMLLVFSNRKSPDAPPAAAASPVTATPTPDPLGQAQPAAPAAAPAPQAQPEAAAQDTAGSSTAPAKADGKADVALPGRRPIWVAPSKPAAHEKNPPAAASAPVAVPQATPSPAPAPVPTPTHEGRKFRTEL